MLLKRISQLSVLLVLLFSSSSNDFFRSDYAELILLIIISILLVISGKRINISTNILIIISIWLLYNIVYLIIYKVFSLNSLFYIPVIVFIVYFVSIINGSKLVEHISSMVFLLSVISLAFYIVQTISFSFAWDVVLPIQKSLGITTEMHEDTWHYSNIIIYTLSDYPSGIPGLHRNFGFMWEPGGFATILLMGFFCHLSINDYKITNIKSIIYLITLITTFSTTGLIGIIVILISITSRRIKGNLISLLGAMIVVFMIFLIFNSPFVKEKIIQTYEKGRNLANTEKGAALGSTGRFGGLFINLREFSIRPVLGHHFDKSERILNKSTASINGLGNILSRYGMFGFFFLMLGYYKSSIRLFGNQKKVNYTFFILLLICSFAFSVNRSPFFMIFFSYGFLVKKIHYI